MKILSNEENPFVPCMKSRFQRADTEVREDKNKIKNIERVREYAARLRRDRATMASF